MTKDTVAEVGIDEAGRLYVRPSLMSFEYIWRAAMEVNWDPSEHRLFGPKPREWTYVDWYKQILAAAANEYGVQLKLAPNTVWSNVPVAIRGEIEALPQG